VIVFRSQNNVAVISERAKRSAGARRCLQVTEGRPCGRVLSSLASRHWLVAEKGDFGTSMRSMKSNSCLVEQTEESPDAVQYICIAADLLRQIFAELRSLALNNRNLARAMSNRDSVLRHRLWVLCETANLLVRADHGAVDVSLMRRATTLISWVSAEIDQLALCAVSGECALKVQQVVLH
jgi:hypothetical protein